LFKIKQGFGENRFSLQSGLSRNSTADMIDESVMSFEKTLS